MNWIENYPERFKLEIKLMKKYTNARLVRTRNGLLQWKENIITKFNNPYTIAITYTQHYPHVAPEAKILKPRIPSDIFYHLYAKGIICLLPASYYSTSHTSLSLRNRAVAWCNFFDIYKKTGRWEGPEH